MARSYICQSPQQNFWPTSKDKLIAAAPTKGSSTPTSTSVVLCASTPAQAPLLISTNSMAKYFKKDLQQIFKTILEAKAPVLTSQPLVFPNRPYKRLLKARFLDMYCDKTYMEYYNFFLWCKDYFATAGAQGQNRISFTAIFL